MTTGNKSYQGSFSPNGNQTGKTGDFYRRKTTNEWEIWYKDSGDNTTTGWILIKKLQ